MKKTDYIGIAFLVLLALLVVFFPINYTIQAKLSMEGGLIHGSFQWTGFTLKGLDQFGNVTRAAPYWMGFLKFALLAMFGEMVKNRIRTGYWHTDLFLVRTVTWGVFGMVMTMAFALFAGGVAGVMGTPLWFGGKDMGEIGNRLIFAISTSFWMNLIFAYPMMLGHEWRRDRISEFDRQTCVGVVHSENDSVFLASGALHHVSPSGGIPGADGGVSEHGAWILPDNPIG